MRRTLVAASLALACIARADVMPLATSNLLLDLQREYPALRTRSMSADDVRKLCEYVANSARLTNGLRVALNQSKAQTIANLNDLLVSGQIDAHSARVQRAVIDYAYGQESPERDGIALQRATLIACRMNLEH